MLIALFIVVFLFKRCLRRFLRKWDGSGLTFLAMRGERRAMQKNAEQSEVNH